jgi:hypothetical protein
VWLGLQLISRSVGEDRQEGRLAETPNERVHSEHPRLARRVIVNADTAQRAVERHVYGVADVEVGERRLALAWGRLVFIGQDFASASSEPGSWTMDLETISYGLLPTMECVVQITIKDGRTMAAEAVLQSTNGRLFRFESRGELTGVNEAEPATDESRDQPVAAGSLN